jgi:general secretion pathway protein H
MSHLVPPAGRRRGFTLIEVLVVLGLIALAITVATVGMSKGLGNMRMRSAGHDLVAALRYTRGQAIVSGEERKLEIDVEKRSYQAPKRPVQTLPKGLTLKLLTAAQERTGDTSGAIRFFPDGSSTGGRVRLIAGARVSDVEVAWLTGEVRLRDATTP